MISTSNFIRAIDIAIEYGISEQELADLFLVSEGTIKRYREGKVEPAVSIQMKMIVKMINLIGDKEKNG